MKQRQSYRSIQRKKARRNGDLPPSAPTTAPRSGAAEKITKLVNSKRAAVISVGGDSAKISQKFKISPRGKSHSTAKKSTAGKKKNVSSKRTFDYDNDEDTSDDSVADYVPSRSLLRRNVAESGDERMSNGSGVGRR